MNSTLSLHCLPSFFTPFVTLSYPTDPPPNPDSFKTSSYYVCGLLDGCLIITCIAVMAILRDALRLGVCEPFARWYLTRELLKSKAKQKELANGDAKNEAKDAKSNGSANGHAQHSDAPVITRKEARTLRHSVIRFAEQGWSFVYYTLQFGYGMVSNLCVCHHYSLTLCV